MADKSLLELPIATTAAGALIYGVQDNTDKAFPANVLQGSESPQAANTVFAGPTTVPGGFPTFRPLVANDIPDLSAFYMASSGGNLANATLSNSTIVGGTISGATAVFDEDKFTLRDTADTTRTGKFNVDLPTAGTSVSWTLPSTSTILVGRDTTDTLTNKKVMTVPSASSGAALRIPPGQPPTSPVNGDIWTTNAGIFVQANNTTVGPLAAETASTVNSFNGRIGAVTLLQADISDALGYVPYNPGTNLSTPGTISASSVSDSGGNLRTAIAAVSTEVSGKVSKTGDTMSGMLTVPGIRNPSGYMDVQASHLNVSTPTIPTGTLYSQLGLQISMNPGSNGDSMRTTYYRHTGSTGTSWNDFNWRTGRYVDSTLMQYTELQANGDMYFQLGTGGGGNVRFTNGGAVVASGGFGPGSDPRLKDESSLKIVDNAVDILYNLNVRKGKYHDWYNPDGKERFFIMADDAMKQAAPEAILEGVIEKNGQAYNGWSADQMIALLVQSVKELKEEIVALKEKNNELSH